MKSHPNLMKSTSIITSICHKFPIDRGKIPVSSQEFLPPTLHTFALLLEKIRAMINDGRFQVMNISVPAHQIWKNNFHKIADDVKKVLGQSDYEVASDEKVGGHSSSSEIEGKDGGLLPRLEPQKIHERFEKLVAYSYYLGIFTFAEAAMLAEVLFTTSLGYESHNFERWNDGYAILAALLRKWLLISDDEEAASSSEKPLEFKPNVDVDTAAKAASSSDKLAEVQPNVDVDVDEDTTVKAAPSFGGQPNVHVDVDIAVKSEVQASEHHYLPTYYLKVSHMYQLAELPTSLRTLAIEQCIALEILASLDSLNSLKDIYIVDCPRLMHFPQCSSLENLYITNCQKLQFPAKEFRMNWFTVLKCLCLGNSIASMESFPLNAFPRLQYLGICECGSLKSLSGGDGPASIEYLEIRDCNSLESFAAADGFSAPNLSSMFLYNCAKIQSLPAWIQTATSLQSLHIDNCPELISLPDEGLPASLDALRLSGCNKIPPKAWKLQKLNSLKHCRIENMWSEMKSFPETGILPTSLTSLCLSELTDLESLNMEGLQELPCLKSLMLQHCEKLDRFPNNWPPSTLASLHIVDCSRLTQKLEDKGGEEWLKQCQIPRVRIDGVWSNTQRSASGMTTIG